MARARVGGQFAAAERPPIALVAACDQDASPLSSLIAVATDDASRGLHRIADEATLIAPKRTPEGYLEATARLGRIGIFDYWLGADGREGTPGAPGVRLVKVLRLPSEVFKAAAIASFDRKPLTRGHPISELIDAKSWRAHAVGLVDQVAKGSDGQHLVGRVMIYDAATIAAVEAGERQMSGGYQYRPELVPSGKWADAAGEIGDVGKTHAVDMIQRDITGNHHAIVTRGRAGPTAAILLDEAPPIGAPHMTPEQIAKMIADAIAKDRADQIKAANDAAIAAKKTADDAAAAKVAADKAAADATTIPPAAAARIAEQDKQIAALSSTLNTFLANDRQREVTALLSIHATEIAADAAGIAALATLDATAIKRKVLEKRGLAAKLPADAPAAVINVAYDTAIAVSSALGGVSPGLQIIGGIAAGAGGMFVPQGAGGGPALSLDAQNARAAYIKQSQEAWKVPIGEEPKH